MLRNHALSVGIIIQIVINIIHMVWPSFGFYFRLENNIIYTKSDLTLKKHLVAEVKKLQEVFLAGTILGGNFENSSKKNKWTWHWSQTLGKYAEGLDIFQDVVVYFLLNI